MVYDAELLGGGRFARLKKFWKWLSSQPPRILINVALIILLAIVVVAGGLHHRDLNAAARGNNSLSSVVSAPISDVDETATVYIAANVATQLNLPIADEVNEQVAEIGNTASSVGIDEPEISTKPMPALTPGETSHELATYVVKEGDKLADIARQYGISTQTIIWTNDISSAEDLVPNMELRIMPLDGTLHRVTEDDYLAGIASTYQVDSADIVSFNDLEVDGLRPGQLLIIPGGVKPDPPAAITTTSPAAFTYSFTPSYGAGNGYDYGYCTWHAANRRAQTGQAIPTNWGNAYQWRYNAAASGYRIGYTPRAGAVAWHNNVGGLGHVAFVERVNEDGAWFSDMNFPIWGSVTHRYVPASEYGNYSFIY